MTSSWGYLGKPPKAVLEGTHPDMALFRRYHDDLEKAKKTVNQKQRSIKMAEIRAKYLRDFPPEE